MVLFGYGGIIEPMYPLLISYGPIHIYSMSAAVVLAWLIFSFLFWQVLRRVAVDEDRIFDLTFYATVAAIFCGRVGYVATHWNVFSTKSPLLMFALWIAPGESWLLGLIGGVGSMVLLARFYKIRVGFLLDACAQALPVAIIIGTLGTFLDGSIQWPVVLYEMGGLVLISLIIMRLGVVSYTKNWPFGTLGAWFFVFYSFLIFMLEFFKESHVYLGSLSANQWILIGIFAESFGILYVRSGGRQFVKKIGVRIYAFISKRHLITDKSTP